MSFILSVFLCAHLCICVLRGETGGGGGRGGGVENGRLAGRFAGSLMDHQRGSEEKRGGCHGRVSTSNFLTHSSSHHDPLLFNYSQVDLYCSSCNRHTSLMSLLLFLSLLP